MGHQYAERFCTWQVIGDECPIIDAAARSFAHRDPANLPCLVFFDFTAALPSVSWKWLFFLLGKQGLPEVKLNLLKAMHTCVMAFSADNSEEKLCEICSGSLQGCRLSGSLFVIAIKFLLIARECLSPDKKQAVVTACADDVGIVLQCLPSAPRVADLFALFEMMCVLQFKAAK